jgi:hypothetical protein
MSNPPKDDKPIRIVRTPHTVDRPYFSMARSTAQDNNLSFEALGILTYLLSKPDGWEVNVRDLCNRSTRYKAYKILRELRKAGYLTLQKEKGAGRFSQWVYQVFETSQLLEFQQVENQVVEIRHTHIIQSNSENTEKKITRARVKPPTAMKSKEKPYSKWQREDVLAYYDLHSQPLDALVEAWGYMTRYKDLTIAEAIIMTRAWRALEHEHIAMESYQPLAAFTRAKAGWKKDLQPVAMLEYVTAWRESHLNTTPKKPATAAAPDEGGWRTAEVDDPPYPLQPVNEEEIPF